MSLSVVDVFLIKLKKKQNSTNLELKGVTVSSVAKVSVPDSAVFYILLSEGHSGGEALVICE